VTSPPLETPAGKPRARALGLEFPGAPGRWNAITDVPGVEVGYQTLIRGTDVRTGVTAIHPRGRADPGDPVAAGFFSLNGNGEMTGVSWIEESGTTMLPITLTNTHAVGVAHEGTVRWVADRFPDIAQLWMLPVAAETWDGYLNDINGGHVTRDDAIAAIESARPGPIEEGSVGGGTGMNCYAFKGGSGTASRLVDFGSERYTVGAFLQCNFGARSELTILGRPLGDLLADDNPLEDTAWFPAGGGSVIAVIATDAPLLPGQCKSLARRVPLGPGPHRDERVALLGRSLSGLLDRQSADLCDRLLAWGAVECRSRPDRVPPVEVDGQAVRGCRPVRRGGGRECADGQ